MGERDRQAGRETRELDPAEAPDERRAAGKPTEGPDVRETERRRAKEGAA